MDKKLPRKGKRDSVPQERKIRRPMNAFILWSKDRRGSVLSVNPGMNFRHISQLLANEWKALSPEVKQPFVEAAKKLREQFKKDHPDFKNSHPRRPPKPAAKPTEQAVEPYVMTPYFPQALDAGSMMPNSPVASDTENRSSLTLNGIETHNMNYSSNTQCTENLVCTPLPSFTELNRLDPAFCDFSNLSTFPYNCYEVPKQTFHLHNPALVLSSNVDTLDLSKFDDRCQFEYIVPTNVTYDEAPQVYTSYAYVNEFPRTGTEISTSSSTELLRSYMDADKCYQMI